MFADIYLYVCSLYSMSHAMLTLGNNYLGSTLCILIILTLIQPLLRILFELYMYSIMYHLSFLSHVLINIVGAPSACYSTIHRVLPCDYPSANLGWIS